MARHEFTAAVRRQIAERAGHQCSFPTCNRRTVSAGADGQYVSRSGYAAHIYSAASQGPRGQGGLRPGELRSTDNGIWLCAAHAKIVDNNKGSAYPPEVLHSYKALHEARVALEHEGLYPPIGWLHEFTVERNPLFVPSQRFQFAKLNLFYGMNGTGKTALIEWITGFFDPERLTRWMTPGSSPIHATMSVLDPKLQKVSMDVSGDQATYDIDGSPCAFIPLGFKVIQPCRSTAAAGGDVEWLSQALNLPKAVIRGLVREVNQFPHARVSNLRFEYDPESRTETLRLDVPGTHPGLPLGSLSGGEEAGVVLEMAIAAARLSGRYCPTLLVLEEIPAIFLEGFFDNYSHHLLDPVNRFQTLMTLPARDLDLAKVRWNGWQVMHTFGEPPALQLVQGGFAS